MAARDARLIDAEVRSDPRANALFLELLTSRNDPETVLRWLNEAGVFGRFVPDFGRVNAQMQFDMYHHYTVDEHTIRAIGLLARIEKGELEGRPSAGQRDHPQARSRAACSMSRCCCTTSPRAAAATIRCSAPRSRCKLCPRLGLSEDETELVAWLVRQHLLMSATAFKRDLADPKTIADFVAQVQSLERLRQLPLLTIVDIRAVGPGHLEQLEAPAARRALRAGRRAAAAGPRAARPRASGSPPRRRACAELLGDEARPGRDSSARSFDDAYWIAEPEDIIALNLRAARRRGERRAADDRTPNTTPRAGRRW